MIFYKLSSHLLICIICISILVPVVRSVGHPEMDPPSFCYKEKECGPSTWGGFCQTGMEQSPINIPESPQKTTFQMNTNYLKVKAHKFYGSNNGHTAQLELLPNKTSQLVISGGGLNGETFVFAQLHFHWGEKKSKKGGSEHTINGVRYPLEIHMVHYNKKYNSIKVALASPNRNALAVMAVLYKIGKKNSELEPIIQALSKLESPGKVMEFMMDLKISNLYPAEKSRMFARYLGSLTTPTCDERVVWTVFMQPAEVSLEQMEKFWQIKDTEGKTYFNFRPIQPLNARQIQYYKADKFTELKTFRGKSVVK